MTYLSKTLVTLAVADKLAVLSLLIDVHILMLLGRAKSHQKPQPKNSGKLNILLTHHSTQILVIE